MYLTQLNHLLIRTRTQTHLTPPQTQTQTQFQTHLKHPPLTRTHLLPFLTHPNHLLTQTHQNHH
uniref:Uncharacterized protein n=1 Tax=Brassica oleracea TaxID=3712 RepID=A0A3P6D988_BRAOL|nr:unnamed protein product [Brassica oleracea]